MPARDPKAKQNQNPPEAPEAPVAIIQKPARGSRGQSPKNVIRGPGDQKSVRAPAAPDAKNKIHKRRQIPEIPKSQNPPEVPEPISPPRRD